MRISDWSSDVCSSDLSATTLDHIIAHEDLGCDNDHLMHLNGHLLRSRYIREIGVLDADNRLICSTALGRLTQPVKGNYPIITLRSGRKLLNDVPLQMADRSEEHTSELQSLMRISYAVFF